MNAVVYRGESKVSSKLGFVMRSLNFSRLTSIDLRFCLIWFIDNIHSIVMLAGDRILIMI